MSKKVIDVSSYQGKIDWTKVKASGVEGAILKIIRKDLRPDNQFENNWRGCQAAGMPVRGVYNYSYATTTTKARSDARRVLEVLRYRKVKVWLDVEDSCQKGLGFRLIQIIEAYQEVIEGAGLEFGVYTGLSFYNSYIRPWAGYLRCKFWIAAYRPLSTKNQPVILHVLEGWQHTSKAKVPGIVGNVDMNIWYGGCGGTHKIPYPVPERVLRRKTILMRGDDVRWAQFHLVRLGFLPALNKEGRSNIDGFYGRDTEVAVIAAQRHYGITDDGVIGAVTRDIIRYN